MEVDPLYTSVCLCECDGYVCAILAGMLLVIVLLYHME